MNNITYDKFLLFKNNINEYDVKLIEKLKQVAENIKSLDLNRTSTFKDKFWNKRVIKSSNKIITLLNVLTELNIDEIFDKIVEIEIKKDELDIIVNHIHKKCCNEYHMLKTYIIIIYKIIHSGLYSYNNNIFWKKLIDNVQNTFIKTDNLEENLQFFTGNILLILFLCKHKLLSLKLLDNIFIFFEESYKNETILNIIFKIIDKIPIFNNIYFVKKINKFLELDIPFRVKFKFKQLLVILDEKPSLQNKLTTFIKDYKNNSLTTNDLSKLLIELPNFNKSLFFKHLIVAILKTNMTENQIKLLIQFAFKKRYKPMNYKKILSSIKKDLNKIKKDNYSCENLYNKIVNNYYLNK